MDGKDGYGLQLDKVEPTFLKPAKIPPKIIMVL